MDQKCFYLYFYLVDMKFYLNKHAKKRTSDSCNIFVTTRIHVHKTSCFLKKTNPLSLFLWAVKKFHAVSKSNTHFSSREGARDPDLYDPARKVTYGCILRNSMDTARGYGTKIETVSAAAGETRMGRFWNIYCYFEVNPCSSVTRTAFYFTRHATETVTVGVTVLDTLCRRRQASSRRCQIEHLQVQFVQQQQPWPTLPLLSSICARVV